MVNDKIPALAYPSVLLLAAGIAGFGALSNRLAVASSIPAGRDRGGWCLESAEGHHSFSVDSAQSPIGKRTGTRLDLPVCAVIETTSADRWPIVRVTSSPPSSSFLPALLLSTAEPLRLSVHRRSTAQDARVYGSAA